MKNTPNSWGHITEKMDMIAGGKSTEIYGIATGVLQGIAFTQPFSIPLTEGSSLT